MVMKLLSGLADSAKGWADVGQSVGEMKDSMAQNEVIGSAKRSQMREQANIALMNDLAETESKMVKGIGESVKGLA